MRKYRVLVDYGQTTVHVDAEDEEDAKRAAVNEAAFELMRDMTLAGGAENLGFRVVDVRPSILESGGKGDAR